jgi:pyruvate/2-oxoglutarate/acetoin dehydrogenase E1 component
MPLRSLPKRVTRADSAIPFAPTLELALTPGKEAITSAVKGVVEEAVAA